MRHTPTQTFGGIFQIKYNHIYFRICKFIEPLVDSKHLSVQKKQQQFFVVIRLVNAKGCMDYKPLVQRTVTPGGWMSLNMTTFAILEQIRVNVSVGVWMRVCIVRMRSRAPACVSACVFACLLCARATLYVCVCVYVQCTWKDSLISLPFRTGLYLRRCLLIASQQNGHCCRRFQVTSYFRCIKL